MTEALFGLIPTYGAWILMIATFLSCLAIPVPTSLIMLAGGAFIASGDLNVFSVVAAAWGGAILGDQAGYFVGRSGGAPLLARARNAPRAAEPIARATSYLHRRGGSAVFFSRWLLSPLGPYVNFIGGAAALAGLHAVERPGRGCLGRDLRGAGLCLRINDRRGGVGHRQPCGVPCRRRRGGAAGAGLVGPATGRATGGLKAGRSMTGFRPQ
jgi:membrane protein YqaA with SNARE-associated domain